ncbi:MAG: hypothetical protein ACE5LU_15810 [Anaerolineae bacterium]
MESRYHDAPSSDLKPRRQVLLVVGVLILVLSILAWIQLPYDEFNWAVSAQPYGTATPTPTATSTATVTLTATSTPSATATATATLTPTVAPATCRIAGRVMLQGRSDHSGVTIRVDGNPAATTGSDGRFTISNLSAGSYRVDAIHVGYLSSLFAAAECQVDEVLELPDTTLLGGDTNNNKQINLLDLVMVGSAYDTCVGDEWYRPEADITETGCVTVFDLVLVGSNYGRTGPTDWPTQIPNEPKDIDDQ